MATCIGTLVVWGISYAVVAAAFGLTGPAGIAVAFGVMVAFNIIVAYATGNGWGQ